MNLNDFDRRLIADPQIGPRAVAGAYALALHRMMQHGSPWQRRHWDDYTESEKLRTRRLSDPCTEFAGANDCELA